MGLGLDCTPNPSLHDLHTHVGMTSSRLLFPNPLESVLFSAHVCECMHTENVSLGAARMNVFTGEGACVVVGAGVGAFHKEAISPG